MVMAYWNIVKIKPFERLRCKICLLIFKFTLFACKRSLPEPRAASVWTMLKQRICQCPTAEKEDVCRLQTSQRCYIWRCLPNAQGKRYLCSHAVGNIEIAQKSQVKDFNKRRGISNVSEVPEPHTLFKAGDLSSQEKSIPTWLFYMAKGSGTKS